MISDRSPTYKKHHACPVWIVIHQQPHPHYASLICQTHNKWIQWISKSDVDKMLALDIAQIRPSKTHMVSAEKLGLL